MFWICKKFSFKGMNKVFFGTLICHAKNELAPINSLLTRASNKFLTEKSIDEAIFHLQRSAEHLLKAKQVYIDTQAKVVPKKQVQ